MIHTIPTADLLFGVPRPPRWWAEHPEHRKEFEKIRESIKTEGLKKPLEVIKTKRGLVVEIGNQRLQALLDLGIPTAPCVIKGD
jgi:ParB-like chromosome segregation protein Spo0J|tara:strand:+ start:55 stop:306 length:252 start_codon:yes stop_codon:yes gene_type:complete